MIPAIVLAPLAVGVKCPQCDSYMVSMAGGRWYCGMHHCPHKGKLYEAVDVPRIQLREVK